jgi:hypothetical protein
MGAGSGVSTYTVNQLTSDDMKKPRQFNVGTPVSVNLLRPTTVQDNMSKRKIIIAVDKSMTSNGPLQDSAASGNPDESHHTPR